MVNKLLLLAVGICILISGACQPAEKNRLGPVMAACADTVGRLQNGVFELEFTETVEGGQSPSSHTVKRLCTFEKDSSNMLGCKFKTVAPLEKSKYWDGVRLSVTVPLNYMIIQADTAVYKQSILQRVSWEYDYFPFFLSVNSLFGMLGNTRGEGPAMFSYEGLVTVDGAQYHKICKPAHSGGGSMPSGECFYLEASTCFPVMVIRENRTPEKLIRSTYKIREMKPVNTPPLYSPGADFPSFKISNLNSLDKYWQNEM